MSSSKVFLLWKRGFHFSALSLRECSDFFRTLVGVGFWACLIIKWWPRVCVLLFSKHFHSNLQPPWLQFLLWKTPQEGDILPWPLIEGEEARKAAECSPIVRWCVGWKTRYLQILISHLRSKASVTNPLGRLLNFSLRFDIFQIQFLFFSLIDGEQGRWTPVELSAQH